jgi:hypothetical protein
MPLSSGCRTRTSNGISTRRRADGFLSTAFSIEQFKEMDREIAVVVGYDGDRLCGYVCASLLTFNGCMPFPAAMLRYAREQGVYRGKPLAAYDFCVTNPIRIDKPIAAREFISTCATRCSTWSKTGTTWRSASSRPRMRATCTQ